MNDRQQHNKKLEIVHELYLNYSRIDFKDVGGELEVLRQQLIRAAEALLRLREAPDLFKALYVPFNVQVNRFKKLLIAGVFQDPAPGAQQDQMHF